MTKESKSATWIREVLPYAIMLGLVLLIRIFILVNAYIPTSSMEGTIDPGARVMGLKTSYWFNEPRRGDIVVFYAPDLDNVLYVKRCIGTPGDVVEIKAGVTYVNGEVLKEDYLREPMIPDDYGPYEVPEDSYFMMGDNRNDSLDSRFWTNTFVTKDLVVGKVYFRYWPNPGWLGSSPEY